MTAFPKSAKRALLYVSVLGIGLAAGVAAGSLRSSIKDSAAKEAERAELQEFLEASLVGIGVGMVFPEIPFTDATTGQQALVRDLLPNGGAIVYVPHAGSWCLRTIENFCDRLEDVGRIGSDAVLITAKPAEGLAGQLEAACSGIRILLDEDGILARDYGVRTWPVAFYVNTLQDVTQIEVRRN